MFRVLLLVIITCTTPVAALADGLKLLLLGDSIGAAYGLPTKDGWATLLEHELRRSHHSNSRVINASVSGETTSGGLQRLPAALAQHQPDIVMIELGGNDGLRGLSLKQMRLNLTQMVRLSQDAGAEVLLLGMQIPSNYGRAYTERFQKVYQSVAQTTEVALMPFLLEPIATSMQWFQADGIHPNAAAQPRLLEALLPYVLEMLPEKTG